MTRGKRLILDQPEGMAKLEGGGWWVNLINPSHLVILAEHEVREGGVHAESKDP